MAARGRLQNRSQNQNQRQRQRTGVSGSVQFEKEASQTRDYCVAKNATLRAARPDPSLRKKRLFRMTTHLRHYRVSALHVCAGVSLGDEETRVGPSVS